MLVVEPESLPTSILEKELRKNVIGTDFSPSMLRKAKEQIRYYVQADALHLTFPNNSLGAIICLTDLTDYTDKKFIFHEFYSCLRKDGIYVHGDYSPKDAYWNLNESTYLLAYPSEFKLARENIEDLEYKLAQEGFTVQKSRYINFKVPMIADDYLQILKTRPGFKFNSEKENQVRKIAEEYLSNDELDRELILIVSKK